MRHAAHSEPNLAASCLPMLIEMRNMSRVWIKKAEIKSIFCLDGKDEIWMTISRTGEICVCVCVYVCEGIKRERTSPSTVQWTVWRRLSRGLFALSRSWFCWAMAFMVSGKGCLWCKSWIPVLYQCPFLCLSDEWEMVSGASHSFFFSTYTLFFVTDFFNAVPEMSHWSIECLTPRPSWFVDKLLLCSVDWLIS